MKKISIHSALVQIIKENGNKINSISTRSLKRKIVIKFIENGQNRNPMDASVLRQLRHLREEGYIVECIEQKKSIYSIEKIGVCNNGE